MQKIFVKVRQNMQLFNCHKLWLISLHWPTDIFALLLVSGMKEK